MDAAYDAANAMLDGVFCKLQDVLDTLVWRMTRRYKKWPNMNFPGPPWTGVSYGEH